MTVQGRGRMRGWKNEGRLKREEGLWGRIGNRKRKGSKMGRDIHRNGRDVVKTDGEERRGKRERGERRTHEKLFNKHRRAIMMKNDRERERGRERKGK